MLMLQQWSSSESGGCHTVGSSSIGSRTMVVQSHGLQHCCSDTAAVQYTCLNPRVSLPTLAHDMHPEPGGSCPRITEQAVQGWVRDDL